jgi:hypothetical protein
MEMPILNNFRLVGGTALALHYGHRISVDIDLFSETKNDFNEILSSLNKTFGNKIAEGRSISSPMGKGISVTINNIKTDIIDWNTPFIKPTIVSDGIRLASKEDIVPMKFNTFLCAPEFARYEKKDFVDIAQLLNDFSLTEMIVLYKLKYPTHFVADRQVLEGLVLHELADKKWMPTMLNGIVWKDVTAKIDDAVRKYVESNTVK